MIKRLLGMAGLLLVASQAHATFDPINTPADIVQCLQTHIQTRVVSPATPTWENRPAFEPAGRYLSASWSSLGYPTSGSAFMFVTDASPVACDYEKNANGTYDMTKPGFCKPTVENAEVTYTYSTFNSQGQKIDTEKKFARIIDSKLVCLNLAHP